MANAGTAPGKVLYEEEEDAFARRRRKHWGIMVLEQAAVLALIVVMLFSLIGAASPLLLALLLALFIGAVNGFFLLYWTGVVLRRFRVYENGFVPPAPLRRYRQTWEAPQIPFAQIRSARPLANPRQRAPVANGIVFTLDDGAPVVVRWQDVTVAGLQALEDAFRTASEARSPA